LGKKLIFWGLYGAVQGVMPALYSWVGEKNFFSCAILGPNAGGLPEL